MILSDVVPQIRRMSNDEVSAYRYSQDFIEQLVKEGIAQINRLRPDSYIQSDGSLSEYDHPYNYAETSGYEQYLDEYNRILAWDRQTNPILYLKAKTASQIEAYYSSASRTTGTTPEFLINGCDTVGPKRIVAANDTDMGGSVKCTYPIVITQTWEVTATEKSLYLDDVFQSALVNYVVSRLLDSDSDEDGDAGKSAIFYKKFRTDLGV